MSITLTGTITGAPQTGFTSPTYTMGADVAPDVNGKQAACTAVGGTQAGVRTHAVSDPFTATFTRPKLLKSLPQVNPITGKYPPIPSNKYSYLIRKGVLPAANVAPQVMTVRVEVDVPAGADSYDAPNVRAAQSLAFGEVWSNSAGCGDTSVSGIM